MEFLAISDKDGEQFQKVVPIKIGDSLCYPVLLYLHSKNPGIEQLQKDLSRYRSTKQILKQLFKDGNNYDATDEWLHSKLIAENSESSKIMWEYTNIMFLFLAAEDATRFSKERGKIAELNAFHEKWNSLPMSEEKAIFSLFRTAMKCDTNVEEFLRLQEKLPNQVIVQGKVSTDNAMQILEDIKISTLSNSGIFDKIILQ